MNVTSTEVVCTDKYKTDNYLDAYNIFVWTLCVLIIIANVLLIFIILKSSGLRSQRFNLIMISLACTDLLVGIMTPFNTIRYGRWNLGHHYCEFVTSMVVILLSASIYNFVCVNLDRLFAVKMPLKYKEMKDKRWLVKLAIFASWLLSLVPAIPMWTSYDTRTKDNDGTCKKCDFPYKSKEWVWWSSVTVFIIPTIVIIVIWLAILHHFSRDVYTNVNDSKKLSSGRKRRERRVTIIMGTITLAFLICWWPYAIIFMLGMKGNILRQVVTLAYLNSLINPVLYIAINKQVRKAIVNMFTCQEKEHDSEFSDSTDGKFSIRKSIRQMSRSISIKERY